MTAFAGIVALGGRPVDRERLDVVARPAPGNAVDALETWADGRAGLACASAWTTPEAPNGPPPLRDEATGVVAVFEGRLDNRAALRAEVGAAAGESDCAYALAAYLAHGHQAVHRLLGDWAVAFWDPRDGGRLLAACDPLGMRPFYWTVEDGFLLFASTLEQVLAALRTPPAVDDDKTITYVFRPLLAWPPGTFLRGVETLRGGEELAVEGGRAAKRRWWRWREHPPDELESRGGEVDEFRALVEDAVRARLRSPGPVGVMLSGGLDSGAIASVAGQQRLADPDLDARAYTFVFDRFASADERRYAEAVTRAFGLPHRLVNVDGAWTLADLETWLPAFTEPLIGPYDGVSYATLPVARDDGVRSMVTGRGGDMLLMGSAKYLSTWLVHGRWRSLARELRAKRRTGRFGYAYQLAAWGLYPLLPGRVQAEVHRRRYGLGALERWMTPAVRARARAEAPRLVHGGPFGWWHDLRHDVGALSSTPQTAYFDRLMRLYGLESRHPLQDVRIVDFALRTPPDVFFRNGVARWVLVDALRDVLPPLVRDRRDKVAGAPLLHYGLRQRRARFVRALLHDSELERRGYVRAEAWKADVERYLRGADDVPVWSSLSVELWLRHREGRLPPLE